MGGVNPGIRRQIDFRAASIGSNLAHEGSQRMPVAGSKDDRFATVRQSDRRARRKGGHGDREGVQDHRIEPPSANWISHPGQGLDPALLGMERAAAIEVIRDRDDATEGLPRA